VAKKGSAYFVNAVITNPATTAVVSFATRVLVINTTTGAQVLPVIINDGYFTLMKGESKNIVVEIDTAVARGNLALLIQPYNGNNITVPFTLTGAKVSSAIIPQSWSCEAAKALNRKVTFRVGVPKTSEITIRMFDLTGRELAVVSRKKAAAGINTIVWNGLTREGRSVRAGTCVYKVTVSQDSRNAKVFFGKLVNVR
jgi:hypothetical protein